MERGIKNDFKKGKKAKLLKALVTAQDGIAALEPVKTNTKIRKARKAGKTQSRKRGQGRTQ